MMKVASRNLFARGLLIRLIASGVLLTLFALTSFAMIHFQTQTSQADALRINMAGKQRMLLEQSIMLSYRLATSTDSVFKQQSQAELKQALNQLSATQQSLTIGAQRIDEQTLTQAMTQPYFENQYKIEQQLTFFLARMNKIAGQDLVAQPLTLTQVHQLDQQVNPSLLMLLDQAVSHYEYVSKRHAHAIWLASALWLSGSMLLIILIYWLFLRPHLQHYQDTMNLRHVLLENTQDMILICDRKGTVLDANQQAQLQLAIELSDNPSVSSLGLESPVRLSFKHPNLTRYPVTRQQLKTLDSPQCEVEVSVSHLPVHNGHYFAVIVRNISESVQHQQALQTQKEAAQQAQQAAEKANAAKSEFIAAMSHELRTPLNAVLGFTQLLEIDNSLSEEQQSYVQEIIQSGQHLLRLITDVLDLSRIESSSINLNFTTVDCGQQIQHCLNMLSPQASIQQISLTSDCLDLPDIKADPFRFKQVLLNLLSNAIKYNKPKGTVFVQGRVEGQSLKILIKDTGIGIAPEIGDEVFTAFSRHGHEMSHIEGTGIGLTISHQLIKLMHGQIGYQSVLGQGCTFWITLPLAQPVTVTMLDTQPKSQAHRQGLNA